MSDLPSKYTIDREALKEELREEFTELIENYVDDSFTRFLSSRSDDNEDDNQEDTTGQDDAPDDQGDKDDEPKDYPLTLLFKNQNSKYVKAIDNDGNLREFGAASEPDNQGNISVKIFAKIDGSINKVPAFYRITYELID